MDHRYIDDESVVKRYLEHGLTSSERAEFETHVVDCQECTDRLLLAEMFHSRNGCPEAKPEVPEIEPDDPNRIRLILRLTRLQARMTFAGAVVLIAATVGLAIWILATSH